MPTTCMAVPMQNYPQYQQQQQQQPYYPQGQGAYPSGQAGPSACA